MNIKLKKLSSLLLVMVMVLSTSFAAFAADSTVTYKGRKNGFTFAPGSSYTKTDLFDNFKNVMPGDKRSEVVTIKNGYSGCDYIKVYMCAELHNNLPEADKDANPISEEVLKKLEARLASASDAEKLPNDELEYMHDFLSQMELTVWKGEKIDKNIIYKGTPDSLYKGFEEGNVYLGKIYSGNSITLNVELAVDIEMDNRYANAIGEVDWLFLIDEGNDPNDDSYDPYDPYNPGKKDPTPGKPPEKIEVIEQPEQLYELPQVLPNLPKTGDDTVIWPYLLLLGLGVVGMILTMFKKRKKEKH